MPFRQPTTTTPHSLAANRANGAREAVLVNSVADNTGGETDGEEKIKKRANELG